MRRKEGKEGVDSGSAFSLGCAYVQVRALINRKRRKTNARKKRKKVRMIDGVEVF